MKTPIFNAEQRAQIRRVDSGERGLPYAWHNLHLQYLCLKIEQEMKRAVGRSKAGEILRQAREYMTSWEL